MVHAYLSNYVLIGLFCRPLVAKNHTFSCFLEFGLVRCRQLAAIEKVDHGCTTTNLSLSNDIKIVFVLQCLHGEIGRTISDVQKGDKQTN